MANRYGEAAIQTARAEAAYRSNPAERWAEVVGRLYPTSETARRKAAPRLAFLALCEAGRVKGIAAGTYAAGNREQQRVLRAVELLELGMATSVNGLWSAVTDGDALPHASQMDVVLALWKNDLIVRR